MKRFMLACALIAATCGAARAQDHPALRARLAELHAGSSLPGFAAAIVTADGVRYLDGYGVSTLGSSRPYLGDTQNVGSVSKTVVGVAVVKAIELGYFTLDTEINAILPFKVVNPHGGKPITVRHLVTHTAGILDDDDVYGRSYYLADTATGKGDQPAHSYAEFARNAARRTRENLTLGNYLRHYLAADGDDYQRGNFAATGAGTTYAYSNIGAALAAYLVEVASGEDFAAFTGRTIFEPLGMYRTGWQPRASGQASVHDLHGRPYPPYALITYPDGGLTTSIADLSRFLVAIMRGHRGEDGILSAAGFKLLLSPQFDGGTLPAASPAGEPNSGILWRIRRNGEIGHTGSDPGVTAFMFFDPAQGRGRILLTNTELTTPGDAADARVRGRFLEIWKALGEAQ